MNQAIVNTSTMNAQQLAEACSRVLHQRDQAARSLGIDIVSVAPGRATLRMKVVEQMLNGHSTCHGGMLFALADTAFAHACNSYNRATVASGCSIDFVAPGRPGAVLTAVAAERQRKGRTGVYDVEVTNQDGEVLAYFRGKAHQVRGTLLPETATRQPEGTSQHTPR